MAGDLQSRQHKQSSLPPTLHSHLLASPQPHSGPKHGATQTETSSDGEHSHRSGGHRNPRYAQHRSIPPIYAGDRSPGRLGPAEWPLRESEASSPSPLEAPEGAQQGPSPRESLPSLSATSPQTFSHRHPTLPPLGRSLYPAIGEPGPSTLYHSHRAPPPPIHIPHPHRSAASSRYQAEPFSLAGGGFHEGSSYTADATRYESPGAGPLRAYSYTHARELGQASTRHLPGPGIPDEPYGPDSRSGTHRGVPYRFATPPPGGYYAPYPVGGWAPQRPHLRPYDYRDEPATNFTHEPGYDRRYEMHVHGAEQHLPAPQPHHIHPFDHSRHYSYPGPTYVGHLHRPGSILPPYIAPIAGLSRLEPRGPRPGELRVASGDSSYHWISPFSCEPQRSYPGPGTPPTQEPRPAYVRDPYITSEDELPQDSPTYSRTSGFSVFADSPPGISVPPSPVVEDEVLPSLSRRPSWDVPEEVLLPPLRRPSPKDALEERQAARPSSGGKGDLEGPLSKSSESPLSEPPVKKRKGKIEIACDRCRGRKTRCDGRTPMCTLCERNSAPCVYADAPRRRGKGKAKTAATAGSGATRPERPRVTSAKRRGRQAQLAGRGGGADLPASVRPPSGPFTFEPPAHSAGQHGHMHGDTPVRRRLPHEVNLPGTIAIDPRLTVGVRSRAEAVQATMAGAADTSAASGDEERSRRTSVKRKRRPPAS
ncbi:uncharacterized protein LAESUDRAFT_712256 [Laetiporus sulphureus 93-53]|uniref:Zn(2)-C6 fungal-type domain-containing protein n=1 Tax=Laetiporus sulphureus 93-53 TaxID=1314785 RepID=A0A165FKK6_9APHY|nr:uncharacterized protein LAESUDRAFT_712256 [Laetiporus sulphureus 93-53]KZT09113.1 hypothetical protein LAESUDRAFT_712256 [Laetiporus sulphureus 93-53]